MKYPLINGQTIAYYVLHALEQDKPQSHYVRSYLQRAGLKLTRKQVSSALQRLRHDGLVVRDDGRWKLTANVEVTGSPALSAARGE
ncbi:MAG: hypothetical protein WAO71_15250 [Gallionella sp.]